jgi:cation transport protein ChaC
MAMAVAHMNSRDFWVFGYGSLIWNPGFGHAERVPGSLRGYHRALCVYSHVHRGTPERPGLVFGLDRGGSCRGIAYRVEPGLVEATVAYLRAREQVTSIYIETQANVLLQDGRRVRALTYVIDPRHPQYASRLDHDSLLHFVRQGHGISGPNSDYVRNTQAHLVELSIRDAVLERLAQALA